MVDRALTNRVVHSLFDMRQEDLSHTHTSDRAYCRSTVRCKVVRFAMGIRESQGG